MKEIIKIKTNQYEFEGFNRKVNKVLSSKQNFKKNKSKVIEKLEFLIDLINKEEEDFYLSLDLFRFYKNENDEIVFYSSTESLFNNNINFNNNLSNVFINALQDMQIGYLEKNLDELEKII